MTATVPEALTQGTGLAEPRARRTGRATVTLAGVEALRLLRHPAVLAGLLLAVLPWLYEWATARAFAGPPILQNADREIQVNLLALGAGGLIAAHLTTLRSHRHATEPLYQTLPLPRWARAVAALAATIPLGLLGVVLVAARIEILAHRPLAAGHPRLTELAAGPLLVVLLAMTGVLLGQLAPRAILLGPLAVLLLAAVTYTLYLSTAAARWLAPTAPEQLLAPLPGYLLGRPAGWHLLYLGTLALLVCALTLIRTGAARSGAPVAVVAAGLVVAAALAQLAPPSAALTARRAAATDRPVAGQTCQRRATITYCAFPDFAAWIPAWDTVTRGVLRALPEGQVPATLTIRQRVNATSTLVNDGTLPEPPTASWQRDDEQAGLPDAVNASTSWSLSAGVLPLAVGVATHVVIPGPAPTGRLCGSRGVVIGWLAAQATPLTAYAYHLELSHSSGGLIVLLPGFGSAQFLDERQNQLISALLAQPSSEVTQRLAAAWPELTAATTSTDRAAALLGVPAPTATVEHGAVTC